MVVELTRADWQRLTQLVHQYGSVGGLERAAAVGDKPGEGGHAPAAIDLAGMVSLEVAHQLAAHHVREAPTGQRRGRIDSDRLRAGMRTLPKPLVWLLAIAAGMVLLMLVLMVGAGYTPLRAGSVAALALLGVHVGIRHTVGLGSVAWREATALCVVAWAVSASWPPEPTALVLASVLGTLGSEPLRELRVRFAAT